LARRPKKEVLGKAVIGIDVGGTKTILALFDSRLEVLAEDKFRSHPETGGLPAFEKAFRRSIEALMRRARKAKLAVRYVGLGCAGDIDMKRGVVRRSPNLTFLDGYPFREKLERLTRAQVFVGHDVQAALYGEYRMGAARNARHVIGVWLGTGVGGAMIVDGRIHLGAAGSAGDIGNYLLTSVDVSIDSPASTCWTASRAAPRSRARPPRSRPSTRRRRCAGTPAPTSTTSARATSPARSARATRRSRGSCAAAPTSSAPRSPTSWTSSTRTWSCWAAGLVEAMPALIRSEVRKSINAHASRRAARAVKVRVAKLQRHAGTVGAARLALDMLNGHAPLQT
jgi:glucokinase